MRKFLLLFSLIVAAQLAAVAGVHRIGTYNIRYPASADSLEKSWNSRKQALCKLVRDTMNYDVLALQEVSNNTQWSYLKSQMPAYTFLMGNYYGTAVAYRTSKYKCLKRGVYYLAPNPSSDVRAWDAMQKRWTVWVKLQDKESGEIFFFGSTHLDLYPISIREGARVNAEQMRKLAGNYACIVAGDMNCEPVDRDPHANYRQYMGNARDMSKTAPRGSYTTFASGMNPAALKQKLIDFVYVHNVDVESYFVSNNTMGRDLMPSDHMPVLCEVSILPRLRPTTHVVNNVAELRQAAREVQAGDMIHLNEGYYDLGDSTLVLANTCTIEGDDNVVITGNNQLITGTSYISLDIRGIRFEGATCTSISEGSVLRMNGNYLNMTDCTIKQCQTNGEGLVHVTDCKVTIDHCLFEENKSSKKSGALAITSDAGAYSFPLTLTNSTFSHNLAYRAPAVYMTSKHTAYMAGNSFIRNQASERGCVLIDALDNTKDIRLVNNAFVDNHVQAAASLMDAKVGGAVVWQNMDTAGCLTLVNNTIVGNYTASRLSSGATSPRFHSGAIHTASGKMKIYNNIIAGNYSSCAGLGDLCVAAPGRVIADEHNVFSSQDNTNYTIPAGDIVAANYAASLQSLVGLYGGEVEDSVYHAPILAFGENQDIWGLSPITTVYAGQDIDILDLDARSAATMGSDILNTGSATGLLTVDQTGATRSTTNSVPGSMEANRTPTDLPVVDATSTQHQPSKVLIGNQLYILKDGIYYSIQGFKYKSK